MSPGARIRDLIKKRASEDRRPLADLPMPGEFMFGQLYRLVRGGETGIFVFLEQHNGLVFAATSPIIHGATSWDIVVPVSESPFGGAFIVEVWNRVYFEDNGTALVRAFLGVLRPPVLDALGELCVDWIRGGEGKQETIRRWVGPPLGDESDWRHEFQGQELDRIRQ